MVGSEYRWFLLHPLIRGAFLSVALAAVCIACLVRSASPAPIATEIADAPTATETAPRDQRAVWPRTVLRLWFLVPQFLPRS